jgi:hypothetical protein
MAETIEQAKNRAQANQEVYQYRSDLKKVWPQKNVDENTVKEAKLTSEQSASARRTAASAKTHAKNLKALGAD